MRLVFLGDLVGRTGRAAAIAALPEIRRRLAADFVIVNAENAAAGFGLTQPIADELFEAGANVITLGNHAFDQKELLGVIDKEPRILKPLNWPRTPGRGSGVFTIAEGPAKGKKVLVANILGRIFMNPAEDPFSAADALLREHPLGRTVDAAVIDFHAEATSEKMALGHWCDGKASLLVGTHTHVPTADHQILSRGTAYLSDAGMCGDYDSVIGMDKTEPIRRFVTGLGNRNEAARGAATVCGVFVEIGAGGRAQRISPLRLGGRLEEIWPPEAAEA